MEERRHCGDENTFWRTAGHLMEDRWQYLHTKYIVARPAGLHRDSVLAHHQGKEYEGQELKNQKQNIPIFWPHGGRKSLVRNILY